MTALADLVALLDLAELEPDVFTGQTPDAPFVRVFGGQVAGQALVAAGRTVPAERSVHSLHAYFLRPGDPAVPIRYEVDRIRDGGSFTTRRVVAVQHGEAIFNLQASFAAPADGLEHQAAMPLEVPDPESLPDWQTRHAPWADRLGAWYTWPRPIDLRYVGDPPLAAIGGGPREARQQVWLRTVGQLPEDPLLHACAVTYASDMTLLDSILLRHGIAWGDPALRGASLDHAVWFHRPFRADEWLLYDTDSPSASGSRGFARGHLFSQDGRLVASVAQEGLLRYRPAG